MIRPISVAVLALAFASLPRAVAITPQETEFFEKQIRPVLAEQCYKCHGPDKQKGSLRMDSRAGIMKGTDDGPIVVPGKPEDSEFIKSIKHVGDSKMPEKADKLPDAQIAALEQWVKMGMPWPDNDGPAKPSASTMDEAKTLWSLQPIKSPEPPKVQDSQHWVKTPVDQFILAKLEEKKIAPSPIADKRTLLRRATFDLIGLPPTKEEVEAFEKDNSPDAFAKVVDRLLASPHYGERWGRYWLDVARYADTKGYLAGGQNRNYPFSYTYRDWVINAFNKDLPYDQFIIDQIAGDKVATKDDPTPMAGMGFLTLGRRFLNSTPDIIDDRIDVVCRGLMGLTVGCARCHDHKFDPILQKDYYALYGVFASSIEPEAKDLPILPSKIDPATDAEYKKQLGVIEDEEAKFLDKERELYALRTLPYLGLPAVLPQKLMEKLFDQRGMLDYTKLVNKVDNLNAGPLAPPRPAAMVDAPQPFNPHVYIRGNPGRPGEAVPRRFIQVLCGGNPQPFKDGSGRLEMAKDIASKDNPLTARVFVNRVWNLHFGAGFVHTPSDFGTKGDLPTHPELLDYLASHFMADGWSIKKLQRAIMLSSVYQQSSNARPDAIPADPDNRLLSHMNRRRLDFEAMRDSLLAAAGQLDMTMGGRPVDLTAKDYAKRRAVYGLIDRQNLPGVFHTFDFATPDQTSPQRHVTTVPQQALFMMNNPFVVDQARAIVAKPEFDQQQAYEAQIQELYQRVFARKADNLEVDAGLRFVMNAITNPTPRPVEQPAWQYGYGSYDENTHKVDFHKLPFFTGHAWQGGAKLPDPTYGYATLNSEGGHAGSDHQRNTIRRWVSPIDGVVTISAPVSRPSDKGDGIFARVVSSRTGELFKSDVLPTKTVDVQLTKVEVKKGDTIDFLVDLRESLDSDSFRWAPVIHGATNGAWDAKAEFAGPPPPPAPELKPWEQYSQVLLETNEFVFVD